METTLKTKQKTNITLMLYPKNGAFFLSCLAYLLILIEFLAPKNAYCQNTSRAKLTKVVIDAGHGGKDPGARGKHTQEKDIVLSVALKVGKLISENCKDVQVVYTRETDVFIPLDVRSQIANKSNANLFISIHANSNKSSSPYGAETYVMGLHKSADNFEVAATENSAIILEDNYNSKYEGFNPKSVESYIIFSMMQSKFLDQSLFFAQSVQNQMWNYANRTNRGVKQAGFLVLWRTAMPSVLVELGFISNAQDEQYMMTDKGQNEMAEAIYRSFKAYKSNYEMTNYVELASSEISVVKDTVKVERGDNRDVNGENSSMEDKGAAVVFRIQVAASVGKPLTKIQKKNLGGEVDVLQVGKIYKYTKGNFSNFEEANESLKTIKKDFKDAFVIAIENGSLISVSEAQQKLRK